MADPTDLVPVTRAEFALELTPCLSLTSGIGMGKEEQTTWLRAAYKALEGIPAGLLQRGAAAAMRKADHPSKIVPAIMAEIGDAWERRRALARNDALALPSPAAVPKEACSPEEAAAICRRYGVGSASAHRPAATERAEQPPSADRDRHCRTPTRADYIRLGVAPETLDAMGIAA